MSKSVRYFIWFLVVCTTLFTFFIFLNNSIYKSDIIPALKEIKTETNDNIKIKLNENNQTYDLYNAKTDKKLDVLMYKKEKIYLNRSAKNTDSVLSYSNIEVSNKQIIFTNNHINTVLYFQDIPSKYIGDTELTLADFAKEQENKYDTKNLKETLNVIFKENTKQMNYILVSSIFFSVVIIVIWIFSNSLSERIKKNSVIKYLSKENKQYTLNLYLYSKKVNYAIILYRIFFTTIIFLSFLVLNPNYVLFTVILCLFGLNVMGYLLKSYIIGELEEMNKVK